ncbi:hypothetical protein FBUS_09064 [Fasciolopsis buskii]|uniref:Uncharacterized protein n=1 Tax=Fasciolopsis buskii TaxID=27845 RepID=A0A8E0RR28_9TREM|nr:hypothetical protein FBUS_09064 [Fasciolopsis buski]
MLWTDAEQHANQEKILENVNDRTKEDSDSDNHPEEKSIRTADPLTSPLCVKTVKNVGAKFPRIRSSKSLTNGESGALGPSNRSININSDGGRELIKAIQIRSQQLLCDVAPKPRGGSLDRLNTSRSTISINSEEDDELEHTGFSSTRVPRTPRAASSCATEATLSTTRANLDSKQTGPDVLKMRCDLLQTHLVLLEARKRSMESSICRLDKELKQKQQNLFEDQSPRLSICEEDANENKILLKRQELSLLQLKTEHASSQQAMIGMIRTEYDREIEQLKCKHIEALEQHRQKLQNSEQTVEDLNRELERSKKRSVLYSEHSTQTDALTLMRNARTSDVDKLLEQICQLRTERDAALNQAHEEQVKLRQMQYEHDRAIHGRSRPVDPTDGEQETPIKSRGVSDVVRCGPVEDTIASPLDRKGKLVLGIRPGIKQTLPSVDRERNMLLRSLIDVLMAVIQTINSAISKMTKVLRIPPIRVNVPASLALADNMDISKIPPGTTLVSVMPKLKKDIPQYWMTALAESVGGLDACCSKIVELSSQQQALLDSQSHSLRELKAVAAKQVDVLYEQLERTKKMQMNKSKQKLLHENTNSSTGDFPRDNKFPGSNLIPALDKTKLHVLEKAPSSNCTTPMIFTSPYSQSGLSPSLELGALACPFIDYPASEGSTPRRPGNISPIKVTKWSTQQIPHPRSSSKPVVGWSNMMFPTTHPNLARNGLNPVDGTGL